LEINLCFDGLDFLFVFDGLGLLEPRVVLLAAVFQLVPVLVAIFLVSQHEFPKDLGS